MKRVPLLTAYDGKSISYDSIGNPTRYYNGSQMRWVGRQLDTLICADGNSCMYDYNADGIRVEKVISGKETHKYLLEGDRIIREEILDKNGARKHLLWYNYDGNGQLTSVEYDGSKYLYKVNQMGDVLGLYNTVGALVVKYRYDAWGKLLEVKTGNGTVITDPENVGLRNPFRYRGYYYDTDTGFYYLNARYYDPETGRFINADGYASTGQGFVGSNMFAYCNNNPVMYADYTGSMSCGATICYFPDQRSHSIDTCRMMAAAALTKGTLSGGWEVHIHTENTNTKTQKHIHVENGKYRYSQNVDGSPHDGSKGSPPKSVKKQLKTKFNWDWDKKEDSYKFSLNPLTMHVVDCGMEEGECTCGSGNPFLWDQSFFTGIPNAPAVPAPSFSPSPFGPMVPVP